MKLKSKMTGIALCVGFLLLAMFLAKKSLVQIKGSRTKAIDTGHSLLEKSTGHSKSTTVMPALQIQPRSETPATTGGNTGPAGTRDDGFGQCPAFTHRHPTIAEINAANKNMGLPDLDPDYAGNKDYFTGGCFDDEERPINNLERRKLPKPAFHADPELNWL